MRQDIKVLPYKTGSASARALANAIGCRQIRLQGSAINVMNEKKIINWGSTLTNSDFSAIASHHTIYNRPLAVQVASDKLATFRLLEQASVRTVPYTSDSQIAYSWQTEGDRIYVRHALSGHSGRGIQVCQSDESLPAAPLYTKYTPRTEEYRVHVVGGIVTDFQRKAMNPDADLSDVDWRIRNHENGFIYARTPNINTTRHAVEEVTKLAIDAVNALRLDFGAVDIIWNATRDKAYVLEVNTACGLEGTTLERYSKALLELVDGQDVTPLDFSELSFDTGVQLDPDDTEQPEPESDSQVFWGLVCSGIGMDDSLGLFKTEEAANNAKPQSRYYNIVTLNTNLSLDAKPVEVNDA